MHSPRSGGVVPAPRESRVADVGRRPVTIAFLGQCHASGYSGVPPEATFPQVCRAEVEAQRPEVSVRVVIQEYHHPSELLTAATHVLRRVPHIVVLEIVGWLAVKGTAAIDLSRLPSGVRSTYQRVRHFRRVANLAVAKMPRTATLVERVHTNAYALATGMLRPLIPRLPRPTIDEYETLIDAAVANIAATGDVHVVVQGPGAPNLALDARGLPTDMLSRYRAVEQSARRIAERHRALYIDRWDTTAPQFYTPGSIRPQAEGHLIWGHLLAKGLLAAGLV